MTFPNSRHTNRNEASSPNVQDSHEEVKLADKRLQYRDELVDRLCKFQMMLDGHLVSINVAKRRINFSYNNMKTVQSAPYRADPKKREFKKVKIDKTIDQKVIDPAQTELAAPIIFATNKNGTIDVR